MDITLQRLFPGSLNLKDRNTQSRQVASRTHAIQHARHLISTRDWSHQPCSPLPRCGTSALRELLIVNDDDRLVNTDSSRKRCGPPQGRAHRSLGHHRKGQRIRRERRVNEYGVGNVFFNDGSVGGWYPRSDRLGSARACRASDTRSQSGADSPSRHGMRGLSDRSTPGRGRSTCSTPLRNTGSRGCGRSR